jgi:hypothetical protein
MSDNGTPSRISVQLNGCWYWMGARLPRTGNTLPYGVVGFAGGQYRVHRVIYQIFKGRIKKGLQVLHSCDTPYCVNPEHLSLGTNKQNQADKAARGRAVGGFKNPEIRALGVKAAQLARRAA